MRQTQRAQYKDMAVQPCTLEVNYAGSTTLHEGTPVIVAPKAQKRKLIWDVQGFQKPKVPRTSDPRTDGSKVVVLAGTLFPDKTELQHVAVHTSGIVDVVVDPNIVTSVHMIHNPATSDFGHTDGNKMIFGTHVDATRVHLSLNTATTPPITPGTTAAAARNAAERALTVASSAAARGDVTTAATAASEAARAAASARADLSGNPADINAAVAASAAADNTVSDAHNVNAASYARDADTYASEALAAVSRSDVTDATMLVANAEQQLRDGIESSRNSGNRDAVPVLNAAERTVTQARGALTAFITSFGSTLGPTGQVAVQNITAAVTASKKLYDDAKILARNGDADTTNAYDIVKSASLAAEGYFAQVASVGTDDNKAVQLAGFAATAVREAQSAFADAKVAAAAFSARAGSSAATAAASSAGDAANVATEARTIASNNDTATMTAAEVVYQAARNAREAADNALAAHQRGDSNEAGQQAGRAAGARNDAVNALNAVKSAAQAVSGGGGSSDTFKVTKAQFETTFANNGVNSATIADNSVFVYYYNDNDAISITHNSIAPAKVSKFAKALSISSVQAAKEFMQTLLTVAKTKTGKSTIALAGDLKAGSNLTWMDVYIDKNPTTNITTFGVIIK